MQTIKCTVVGDGCIGKTSLLISYTTNSFDQNWVPTVFDGYSVNLMVDNKPVHLSLWDTSGQFSDYERLRPLSYPNTDVFLIVFSVSSTISFKNVSPQWIGEVRKHCPQTPVVLVGSKSDTRTHVETADYLQKQGNSFVDVKDAEQLAKDIGAVQYLECSAKTQAGLKDLFDTVVRIALKPKPNNTTGCFGVCTVL